MSDRYTMTISRLTVDKLGVKLYDRVSTVMAELIANSYDADATEVKVSAPMGEFLATKMSGQIQDKGFSIIVQDNGIGMYPDVIDRFYLKVGAERRDDPERGDTSPRFGRKVMGRKGIGKLAPFGICEKVEVITSGGDLTKGENEEGDQIEGYETANFILDRQSILQETDEDYHPVVGPLDGKTTESAGTTIKLTIFDKRRVPTLEQFERQLAQRFGIRSDDWKVTLIDSTKTSSDPDYSRDVGEFSIGTMDNTMMRFQGPADGEPSHDPNLYRVIGPDGQEMSHLTAGFRDDDGVFYGITGWVAYARQPYKDDLMAGIRIYCRGKIAAQTSVFGRKAGFTGEHDVRSYLVGELEADWLDDSEDLIQTDRRDILWSHYIGQRFKEWGQHIVREIGKLSRHPMRKRIWDEFQEIGKVDERIQKTYPRDEHEDIRDNAWEIIETIGSRIRREELAEAETIENYVDLGMMLAPHITLNKKLKEAADESTTPLSYVSTLLRTARIAELSSYGRVAENRIKVIEKLFRLKTDPEAVEADFQNLIKEAPWLIDPQWSPLTANQAFSTLKQVFEQYYKQRTGREITLNDFSDPNKRPDFVLTTEGRTLQLVEIKKPEHTLFNDEMDRIINYVQIMDEFLGDRAHEEFRQFFDKFHVTLVCENKNLTGAQAEAFKLYETKGTLTWINWNIFLLRTKNAHQAFLEEAERQREYGTE